jgi:hypothetical protein
MTKNDLKTGMLVEFRSGAIGMVLNNVISGQGEEYISDVDNFNDDLTYGSHSSQYDIMRVSQVLERGKLARTEYWNEKTLTNNCVWKRFSPPPVKEMTVAEISAALGYEVKIVK